MNGATMRTRLCLPTALAALAAVAAAPAGALETGVNETLGQTIPAAQTAPELGAGWVRAVGDMGARAARPDTWDQHIVNRHERSASSAAKARGLKVLMVVQRTPAWANGGKGGDAPPTDPATFGAAMGGFAAKVPGVDAWELWNEQDGARASGRRRRPGEVRGDDQGRLPGDQGRRSRTTSWSPAPRSATTSTSSRRSTRTAPRAPSTRSASTPTPPAWSTAPTSTTATSRAGSPATCSPAIARCTR